MWRPWESGGWRQAAKQAVAGNMVLAALTAACYGFHLNFPTTAFLFVLAVLLQGLKGSLAAAAIVSCSAALYLDYFFVEPLLTFRVRDRMNFVALSVFVICSLIIAMLSARARRQAAVAHTQRQNIEQLYELAQQILAMAPESILRGQFIERFRGVFGLKAVCLFDGTTIEVHMQGVTNNDLESRTRQAFILSQDSEDPASAISVRCLRAAGRTTGAIAFEGLRDPDLMAGPLAALAAAALERARAFSSASLASAEAQAEVFRGAILDALAHEFKTPLATILTAAGGLREAGPLGPEQLELAEMVETESFRLGHLTSRFLRMARLDQEEVKPRMEPVDVQFIVSTVIDRYARLFPDHRFSLLKMDTPSMVQADEELLRLALGQVIDNACKYSQPGSTISIDIGLLNRYVAIRISNDGPAIPSAERDRIFERFYRGAEARKTGSGSGLGLYVARKIAIAHGGNLDLDSEDVSGGGGAFRLTIPTLQNGNHFDSTNI